MLVKVRVRFRVGQLILDVSKPNFNHLCLVFSIGMYSAGPGESCTSFCQGLDLTCSTQYEIFFKNGTDMPDVTNAGGPCNPDEERRLWNAEKPYLPAINKESGKCEGYAFAPNTTVNNCNASSLEFERLCICVHAGKGLYNCYWRKSSHFISEFL